MDSKERPSNDSLNIYLDKISSISHITAAEERALWRPYIKWRQVKNILGLEVTHAIIRINGPNLISSIIKNISDSHELIQLLRKHSGIEEIGDCIMEDESDNVAYISEFARRVFTHRSNLQSNVKVNNARCCLKDVFGSIFGEMINNVSFGSGNANLVNKITSSLCDQESKVRNRIYHLAVNRELIPKSLINMLELSTPLSMIKDIKLPYLSKEYISRSFYPFILNIKKEGEIAFNSIVESHLWLVVNIVNKNYSEEVGMQNDDLVQEGNLGLIEAAERFEPFQSKRFMSYAHWWIFQKINRAIEDQSSTIRIPAHMRDSVNRFLETSHNLSQKYGREPTVTEIAEAMGITEQKIHEIVKVAQPTILLDLVLGEEENNLSNYITDTSAPSLDDNISLQLLKEQIDKVLSSLTQRERKIIELRFGLEDGRSRTLEEIGQEFKLTRERIRQIEAKALRKLRHPSRSRKLKGYL